MNDLENRADQFCAIYVDMGTTNTRVWLLRGREVLAHASKQVGVRDSAHDGTTIALRATLKELITKVQDEASHSAKSCEPVCVVAAGMIGSALGLAELPHLPAPAGMRELSRATVAFAFPELTALPFLLVPGVRSGSMAAGFSSPHQFDGQYDVMRGEETLCVGLHALGLVQPPAVVLTLGSHWKAIQLDAQGRIQRSVTSLSGEVIQAVQTQTILASSVTSDWPDKMATEWLEAGMAEQRRSGLSRALFCVRLLELQGKGTAEGRLAYLLGAFIATDLDALVARGILEGETRLAISGHPATTAAWVFALAQTSIRTVPLSTAETERAFLAGLNGILIEALSTQGSTRRFGR